MTIGSCPKTMMTALVSTAMIIVPTVFLAAPAQAIIVYDPTNYAQNILQAARALEQIQNQIKSLQNEAQGLINQARSLTKLPFSVLDKINESVAKTQALLKQAQRIAYDVRHIDAVFKARYGTANLGAKDADLVAEAKERWSDSIDAFQDALRVQAGIVDAIETTRAQVSALIGHSQEAVGELQAVQAGNQLLALQTKQLADLTGLMAADGRARALEAAGKASAQAQAREQYKRFLGKPVPYQPATVRVFGQ